MTRYPPLCGRVKIKEEDEKKRGKRVVTLEKEKIVKWTIDDKENWKKKKDEEGPQVSQMVTYYL